MAANLDQMPFPAECCAKLQEPREQRITNHRIEVDLDWWNHKLDALHLPGRPISGIDHRGRTVETGTACVSRGDLLALAAGSATSGEGALRLLWHTLAWGAGRRRRLCRKRMRAVVGAGPDAVGELLRGAGTLTRTDPGPAYRRLRPVDRRNAISYLGPSFFTKYLYFAAGDQAEHGALILDQRVARTLRRNGWTTLERWNWPAETYEQYLRLLQRWAAEKSTAGRKMYPDEIERCLFDLG